MRSTDDHAAPSTGGRPGGPDRRGRARRLLDRLAAAVGARSPAPPAGPAAAHAVPRARRFTRETPPVRRALTTRPPPPGRAHEEAIEQAADAPEAAVEQLERLRREHPADPRVAQALALALHRSGQPLRAVATARDAVPLCFTTSQGLLAAELLAEIEADAHALGFGRDELMALGGALGRTAWRQVAFRAFASLLMRDPRNARATQALLELGCERLAAGDIAAEEAWEIFQFLAVVSELPEVRDAIEAGLAAAEAGVAAR